MNSLNVYVTVGATVPFHELIQQTVNNLDTMANSLLKTSGLNSLNTINLVFQHGNNYADTFSRLIEEYTTREENPFSLVSNTAPNNCDKNTDECCALLETPLKKFTLVSHSLRLNIYGFSLSNNLGSFLQAYQPELFISHAGTGSLLDALKLVESTDKNKSENKSENKSTDKNSRTKVVLCVVNDQLMDNHQLDIARKFAALGLVQCVDSPKSLNDAFENVARTFSEKHTPHTQQNSFKTGFNNEFQQQVLLGGW